MIKIYLLDFTGAEAAQEHRSLLPDFVTSTKNPNLRRERIFSYMLLSFAYREYCLREKADSSCAIRAKRYTSDKPEDLETAGDGSFLPKIERDGYGRPYFECRAFDFNISHDGNMAALVISDAGRVGIDIQRVSDKVSPALKAKTDALFCAGELIKIPCDSSLRNAELQLVGYSETCGIFKTEAKAFAAPDNTDFFYRWTAIEALSKADGRGLALFSRIDEAKENFTLRCALVSDKEGKSYAVSVCKRKGEDNPN